LTELRYGTHRWNQKERSEAALDRSLAFAKICEWLEEAAEHYDDIRAVLERAGVAGGELGARTLAAKSRRCCHA